MDKSLRAHLEYVLCIRVESALPVHGGDISQAFLVKTATERFFCKVNQNPNALAMFQAEKMGLKALAETRTIAVPKVLLCEEWESGGFLLMEYIEPKNGAAKDMELLGHQLAGLHQFSSSDTFGLATNNYIGSLGQSNTPHPDWSVFYVSQRLLPLLKMAQNAKLLSPGDIPTETTLLHTCGELLSGATPSLLHGDFWCGNYLISSKGTPYLIDPAVYFGHYEVDLAMSRLFGGFDASFYGAHSEHFPGTPGERERRDIYQLYYLLVHLNLFGGSYRASCKKILQRYFY
ncbi:fructosamine kinase family protein [Maribacter sp. 2307ULW6-5]|uniref:fructosamine kinase family protein n=1 Tax=Maribacter sp. 2307ULW6-5 TaxID=3386275 RepID=UPI0039BCE3F4